MTVSIYAYEENKLFPLFKMGREEEILLFCDCHIYTIKTKKIKSAFQRKDIFIKLPNKQQWKDDIKLQ